MNRMAKFAHRGWTRAGVSGFGLVGMLGLASAGCAPGPDNPGGSGSEPTATLAVVGQALIEHDPREYLEAPLATVAPILAVRWRCCGRGSINSTIASATRQNSTTSLKIRVNFGISPLTRRIKRFAMDLRRNY